MELLNFDGWIGVEQDKGQVKCEFEKSNRNGELNQVEM